jgi:hypothetical protein
MIKIESADSVDAELFGHMCKLRKPLLSELRQYHMQINDHPSESVGAVLGFLMNLGVPENIAEQFNADQAMDLIGQLTNLKKS